MSTLGPALRALDAIEPMCVVGQIDAIRGLTLLVEDLPLPIGSLVSVRSSDAAGPRAFGEVVGFTRERAIVMPLGQTQGIRPGDRVVGEQIAQTVGVGPFLLGRVIDGLGRPIDGLGPIRETTAAALLPGPVGAMTRPPIRDAIRTGVRAIDLMTAMGRGQRMGIFSGPGVGKSTLLGMIAKKTSADVSVIALIGERGREVREFIEQALGPDGLARSVVVVATGDESPVMRLRAARVACAAAESFRDTGLDVMLMMDSITRFAHAQRQVGLSIGEPPATKGYTPSVFATLSTLLERAGTVESADGSPGGSITGIYSILVEGDDLTTDPIADAARGILDGHLVLTRALATKGHYPAIDVLDSVSRVASTVCDDDHVRARTGIIQLLAKFAEVEDLVQIGAYAAGSDPETDTAIELNESMMALLRQDHEPAMDFDRARSMLIELADEARTMIDQKRAAIAQARGGS